MSFSWENFNETNLGWGAITGYRVYYSTSKSILNNIYETSASYIDVPSAYVEIDNLIAGRYYYVKIVAARTTPGGKQYFSTSNMDTIELIVPPENTFYDYDLKVVVDKYLSPQASPRFASLNEVIAGCDNEIINVVKNGSIVTKRKKLVTSAIFDVAKSEPTFNDYTYQIVPHWMADPEIDIEPIFTPDFQCTDKSGSNSLNTIFYQKDCSDCSCNFLSKIEGGDGESLPPSAILYIDGESTSAAQRCYFTL